MDGQRIPHNAGDTPAPARQRVQPQQRFHRNHRCPVCGGSDDDPRHQGIRCHGFAGIDGDVVFCTNADWDHGGLEPVEILGHDHWVHELGAICPCGEDHDESPPDAAQQRRGRQRHRRNGAAPTPRATGPRIVAIYPYCDEDGQQLYQIVRYVPKTFRPRRMPHDDHPADRARQADGWIYNLDGVRRVPYHLDEVVVAEPKEPIYLTEGEGKADVLRALGLVTTCASGGAGKWDDAHSRYLVGRRVIVLPDDDAAGARHVLTTVESLRRADCDVVALAPLPGSGAGDGWDIANYLAAGHTRDDLEALVAEAYARRDRPSAQQEDSQQEHAQTESAPVWVSPQLLPFPTHALPKPLCRFVLAGAGSIGCPPDFLGLPLLSGLGAAIGNARVVEIKPGWEEHPCLWTCIVAEPGDRKSPALKLAQAPFERRQRHLQDAYVADWADYQQRRAQYEVELSEWQARVKKHDHAAGAKPQEPEAPVMKQCFTTDATMEALADVLQNNPRGVLFPRDELTGWARGMNQYRAGGRGDDRQRWLSMWNGAAVMINRRSRAEPQYLEAPFVAVTGALPPDVLGELSDERGREDGFVHRLLFAYPASERQAYSDDGMPRELVDAACDVFDALWALQLDDPAVGNGAAVRVILGPRPVRFVAEGKAAFVTWINAHTAEQQRPGFPESLRGPWAKLDGTCARIALIVQLSRWAAGETTGEDIDAESMASAEMLISYFKAQACKVYERLHSSADERKVERLWRWITGRNRPHAVVTVREVLQHTKGLGNARDIKALFGELAERGYGTVTTVTPTSGRRTVEFRPGGAQ